MTVSFKACTAQCKSMLKKFFFPFCQNLLLVPKIEDKVLSSSLIEKNYSCKADWPCCPQHHSLPPMATVYVTEDKGIGEGGMGYQPVEL